MRKYNCEVCNEVFFVLKNRTKHMEECHPEVNQDEKSLRKGRNGVRKCDYCSALIRSSDLHDHTSTCEAFQSMVQKHKEKDHISFSYAKLVNCEFVIKKGS